mmetsp:Transcript_20816/g.42848  ORF Transcript_20816/g.42848 Transcript_20816/m.42848 type:complete len:294 (-) Transcript_20816:152-1033(-)
MRSIQTNRLSLVHVLVFVVVRIGIENTSIGAVLVFLQSLAHLFLDGHLGGRQSGKSVEMIRKGMPARAPGTPRCLLGRFAGLFDLLGLELFLANLVLFALGLFGLGKSSSLFFDLFQARGLSLLAGSLFQRLGSCNDLCCGGGLWRFCQSSLGHLGGCGLCGLDRARRRGLWLLRLDRGRGYDRCRQFGDGLCWTSGLGRFLRCSRLSRHQGNNWLCCGRAALDDGLLLFHVGASFHCGYSRRLLWRNILGFCRDFRYRCNRRSGIFFGGILGFANGGFDFHLCGRFGSFHNA